jgi:tRNA isopentenyl-2-thiomethyl-A-37 hydroxylase MiaE
MLGGIYSEDKCPVCGAGMQDNHRDGVCCPKHKTQKAHKLIVRFGRQFYKRSTSYEQACRILTGIRFKFDEGTYDPRDYQQSNPLGLGQQIEKYLSIKDATLKPGSLKSLHPHVKRIQNHFGAVNVKGIGYAEIEDFLVAQTDIGDKTKHCLCSVMHDFFTWLVKRKVIRREHMPEFPSVKFALGYRKVITKQTQAAILEEVKRTTINNPRIYIGTLWLSTYINMRPSELLGILEEHIDYDRSVVYIRSHKTDKVDDKEKIIPLHPDDLEMIKRLPRGFPKMHFFRRDRGTGGRKAGTVFGKDLLYKTWKRACANLGIEGVDLYGGTRHSSATALRQFLSFEDTKRLTGHETNKAFERYYQKDLQALRDGYALTRCNTNATPNRAGEDEPRY